MTPNEVNVHQVIDESPLSRIELSSGETSLARCHTTGHPVGFGGGERYSLRLPDDVKKQIVMNYGRSASDGEFRGREVEGGSSRESLVLSLAPPTFSSHGNVMPASSSLPHYINTVQGEVFEFEDSQSTGLFYRRNYSPT